MFQCMYVRLFFYTSWCVTLCVCSHVSAAVYSSVTVCVLGAMLFSHSGWDWSSKSGQCVQHYIPEWEPMAGPQREGKVDKPASTDKQHNTLL